MLRQATDADAAAIAWLHVASWQIAYRGLLPDAFLDGLNQADQISVWQARLAMPDRIVRLAEDTDGLEPFSLPGSELGAGIRPPVSRLQPDLRVEEVRTALAGFCASGPTPDDDARGEVWHIFNLHVAPDRRRTGIGGLLFDDGCRIARARGARELTLWVADGNTDARRFYERKGMAPDGKGQARPFAPGVKMDVMRYALALR